MSTGPGKALNHKRSSDQIWIVYMLESPQNASPFSKDVKINWTATYRSDSELVAPYEKWVYYDDSIQRRPVTFNYAANKTKKVAWFVSNCNAANNRLQYAQALQEHIQVDIYGACGPHKCPRHTNDCAEMLSRDYKFYLAFENSNCKEFVLFKLFKFINKFYYYKCFKLNLVISLKSST